MRMTERVSKEDFAKQLHTKFRVRAEGAEAELELDEVAVFEGAANDPSNMERFSIFFEGPQNVFLQQGVYTLDHEQLGELTLFIVPVERSTGGFRYESVFNYFNE